MPYRPVHNNSFVKHGYSVGLSCYCKQSQSFFVEKSLFFERQAFSDLQSMYHKVSYGTHFGFKNGFIPFDAIYDFIVFDVENDQIVSNIKIACHITFFIGTSLSIFVLVSPTEQAGSKLLLSSYEASIFAPPLYLLRTSKQYAAVPINALCPVLKS